MIRIPLSCNFRPMAVLGDARLLCRSLRVARAPAPHHHRLTVEIRACDPREFLAPAISAALRAMPSLPYAWEPVSCCEVPACLAVQRGLDWLYLTGVHRVSRRSGRYLRTFVSTRGVFISPDPPWASPRHIYPYEDSHE